MSDLKRSQAELQEMFASAVELRKGAEFLLVQVDKHADCAAVLCNAGAIRMMDAYCEFNELQPDGEMDADLWNACMAHREELYAIDDDAQLLLDCGCPHFPKSAEKAQFGVESAIRMEKAMLAVSPELAAAR